MAILRMDIEEVRNAAHQIERAVERLYMKPNKLKGLSGALNSAWDGGRSSYYVSQLRQLGSELQKEVIKLQKLAQRTRQEIDEWEAKDQNWQKTHVPAIHAYGPLGAGGTPEKSHIPVGWLDHIREQLKQDSSVEYEETLDKVTAIGALMPIPIAGDIVAIIGDMEAGWVDFLQWAIPDWEKYNTLGHELAATMFDMLFFYVRQSIVLGVDIVNLLAEVLHLFPGLGWILDKAVDVLCWTTNYFADKSIEQVYEAVDRTGIKDLFVNSFGSSINDAIQTFDSSFDPTINQIMTAGPQGVSGSW